MTQQRTLTPRNVITLAALVAGLLTAPSVSRAGESAGEKSPAGRRLTVAVQYPGITVDPDDKVSVDVIVNNSGDTDETVLLEVSEKPEGWKAVVKTYSEVVSGTFVAAGKDKTLTFSAELENEDEKKLPSGTHHFEVQARTTDGSWVGVTTLDVTVRPEEEVTAALVVDTSYPQLSGAPDEEFKFTLDVKNKSDEDVVVNFKATSPGRDWDVSFKPAYESKKINSLQIEADQSKSVEVEVKPPYNAEAGEFPIRVDASVKDGNASDAVDLLVTLSGTYRIEAVTQGDLLSLTAQAGKPTNLSVYVRNRGSAPQEEITFVSFKPEKWKVDFEVLEEGEAPQEPETGAEGETEPGMGLESEPGREKIVDLEPGGFRQVEVTITPSGDALIGDYSVALQVQGEKSSDDLELRVTVKASTTWGWVGVGIIVLVILGLAMVFKFLGRR